MPGDKDTGKTILTATATATVFALISRLLAAKPAEAAPPEEKWNYLLECQEAIIRLLGNIDYGLGNIDSKLGTLISSVNALVEALGGEVPGPPELVPITYDFISLGAIPVPAGESKRLLGYTGRGSIQVLHLVSDSKNIIYNLRYDHNIWEINVADLVDNSIEEAHELGAWLEMATGGTFVITIAAKDMEYSEEFELTARNDTAAVITISKTFGSRKIYGS
ncbi:unnamed protein product [marine sediment metagenome]|uniref:Uncharacterized protein n=1 Tax=marine sediment metagenome TaxID=412755 RepID=X1KN03_9ZZZZ